MERGQEARQTAEVVADVETVAHQLGQAPVVRHAAHHQDVLARVPVGIVHRRHAEVDIRGDAPVHRQLAATGELAARAGREVEEAEVDRLLDLVGAVPHEQDDRRMGLADGGRG
ncbi:MAG: hypothetical protein ABJA89_15495 [Lapillicoccus sp.]